MPTVLWYYGNPSFTIWAVWKILNKQRPQIIKYKLRNAVIKQYLNPANQFLYNFCLQKFFFFLHYAFCITLLRFLNGGRRPFQVRPRGKDFPEM